MESTGLKKALTAMGYREFSPGKWSKPVAYHCFTYTEETGLWDNWFFKTNGEITCWQSNKVECDTEDIFLSNLKYLECYTRTNVDSNTSGHFEFLTLVEKLNFEL